MNTVQMIRDAFLEQAKAEEEESKPQILPQIASVVVFIFGGLVLLGWSLELEPLRLFLAQLVAMKVNSALGFLLAGLSLWMFHGKPAGKLDLRWLHKRRVLAAAYAVAVIAIGVLTMTEELTGTDLGLNRLIFKGVVTKSSVLQVGSMGFGTALCFVLIGAALLLAELNQRQLLARTCIILVALFSLLALIGNRFGLWFMFGNGASQQLAVPTAGAFLLLCTAVFAIRWRQKKT